MVGGSWAPPTSQGRPHPNTQRLTLETSMVSARILRIGSQKGQSRWRRAAGALDYQMRCRTARSEGVSGARGPQKFAGSRKGNTAPPLPPRLGNRSELRRPVTKTKNLGRVRQLRLRATRSDAFRPGR